jgi:hypothetical protein
MNKEREGEREEEGEEGGGRGKLEKKLPYIIFILII